MSGQQLVAEAANRLAQEPALAAKIRQRADLFGQQLVGSGSYHQVSRGAKILVRLELKLQVAGQLTSLQQTSDGEIVWTRRNAGDRRTISYVDLRRVRRAISEAGDPPAVSPEAIAQGGLPKLLRGLDRNFTFDPPREAILGRVPVWVLRGQWKSASRAASPRPEPSSPQRPDSVTLALGRDEFVPLFPYRIEFARRDDPQGKQTGSTSDASQRPIVVMEFFEVRRSAELDHKAFVYQVGDQPVEDHTELYLQRLTRPR
jgi:hypothetical protein